jgi:hypothetical protein
MWPARASGSSSTWARGCRQRLKPMTSHPAHTEALLAAYHTAIEATTRITAALDDLTRAVNTPSRLLAATRRASAAGGQPQRHRPLPRQIPQPPVITPPPGRTVSKEPADLNKQIRSSMLLMDTVVGVMRKYAYLQPTKAQQTRTTHLAAVPCSDRRTYSARRADSASPSRSPRRCNSAVEPSMSVNSIVMVPTGNSFTAQVSPLAAITAQPQVPTSQPWPSLLAGGPVRSTTSTRRPLAVR